MLCNTLQSHCVDMTLCPLALEIIIIFLTMADK